MYQYQCLVRINGLPQHTTIYADNDNACKQMIESMYGRGSAMSYHRV